MTGLGSSRPVGRSRLRLAASIVGLAVLAAGPLLALAYGAMRTSSQAIDGQVRARARTEVSVGVTFVRDQLDQITALDRTLASSPGLAAALAAHVPINSPTLRTGLAEAMRLIPGIAGVGITGPTGVLVTSAAATVPIGTNLASRPYFHDHFPVTRTTVTDGFTALRTLHAIVASVTPVRATPTGPVVGYVLITYSVATIQSYVDNFARSGIDLQVADHAGQVLGAPGLAPGHIPDASRDPAVAAALRGGSGAGDQRNGRVSLLAAWAPVPDVGWAVVATVPQDTAYAAAANVRRTVLFLAGVLGLVIVAGLVVYSAASRRRQRLEQLLAAERNDLARLLDGQQALLGHGPDLDAVAAAACASALGIGDAASAFVQTLDGDELVYRHAAGTLAEVAGSRLAAAGTLSGLAAATNRAYLRADVWEEGNVHRDVCIRHGVRSLMVAPLTVNGEVWAVLEVTSPRRGNFDERHLALLQVLATLVSSVAVSARATGELVRSNAELEQFAYIASHDLSEPLRVISGFVQLLAQRYEGRLDPDADEFIGFVLDGVKRMQALITDLLEYSRTGHTDLRQDRIDTREVMDEVTASMDRHLDGAELTVGPLPVVTGDAGAIARVLRNLISNAVKFTPTGAAVRVEVSARRDGHVWELCVADHGIGIDAEHRNQIFEMFERLHGQDDYAGTGIGLSICQRLVERGGGRIWVEDNDPTGSRFLFTIPMKDDADAPQAPTGPAGGGQPRGRPVGAGSPS